MTPKNLKDEAKTISNHVAMILAISMMTMPKGDKAGASDMMDNAVATAATIVEQRLVKLREELRGELLAEIHDTNAKLGGIVAQPATA